MRLHVVHAADTSQAVSRVREALGDDAVILSSQTTADGVWLTAAVERGDDDLANLLTPPDAGRAREEIAAALAHHRTLAAVSAGVLEALPAEISGAADMALAQALASWGRFRPLRHPVERPLMLVGPHGGGKTTTVARLVVDGLLAGQDLGVISTDTGRAGGMAPLSDLLRPLGRIPVAVLDGGELSARLGEAGPGVIVDTPGTNALKGEDLARLAELLRSVEVEPVLVLPAGLCPDDSLEIAANFAALGVRRMIVTKLDSARRLGGLLSAAATGVAFAAATLGPTIGRGSAALSAVGLARILLRRSMTGHHDH